MIQLVDIPQGPTLDDYAASMHLTGAVEALRQVARECVPKLAGRTVWMVNSTARGGGVAEMLPQMVGILNELGLRTKWAVIGTDKLEFFDLTKRLHNLIHGSGKPELSAADRALFEDVSQTLYADMRPMLSQQDVLLIHDPQPAGMGSKLKQDLKIPAVWRCHIGLDQVLPQTKAAWNFLKPYLETYDHAIFTAPEYVPDYLRSKWSLSCPALDPFSPKNRELSIPDLVSILYAARLATPPGPVLAEPFAAAAERLQPDGSFKPANQPEDIGVLSRPIIMEVSRWDNLKGWVQLMDGFILIKQNLEKYATNAQHRKTLELMRLVLAGPDPAAVADDPEAMQVLGQLIDRYKSLPAAIQKDVVLLSLPMKSLAENAMMVAALQRCCTVVVQNSIQEGFGLTATEPMWKGTPTLVSSACGLRQQVKPGVHGLMIQKPGDPTDVAATLAELLADPARRATMARAAQRRVRDEFLVFTQLQKKLRALVAAVG
jgi:trehalose synthase